MFTYRSQNSSAATVAAVAVAATPAAATAIGGASIASGLPRFHLRCGDRHGGDHRRTRTDGSAGQSVDSERWRSVDVPVLVPINRCCKFI